MKPILELRDQRGNTAALCAKNKMMGFLMTHKLWTRVISYLCTLRLVQEAQGEKRSGNSGNAPSWLHLAHQRGRKFLFLFRASLYSIHNKVRFLLRKKRVVKRKTKRPWRYSEIKTAATTALWGSPVSSSALSTTNLLTPQLLLSHHHDFISCVFLMFTNYFHNKIEKIHNAVWLIKVNTLSIFCFF